jgi:membrane-associated phospholipid phosphatase
LKLFSFELLAAAYFPLVAAAGLLTARARRSGAWKALAIGTLSGGLVLVMAQLLSPAARLWFGHLYLAAGYWIPALSISGGAHTRFEAWLQATDSRWGGWVDAVPAWLIHVGEIAYLLCYPLVPAAFLIAWLGGNDADSARFWLAVLGAGFACYATLPWLAARPPRLLPAAGVRAHPISRLNTAVLSRVSHNLTTFPSGHVAVAVAAALAVGRVSPAAGILLFLFAAAISLGAITGRYHYVIDVAAGVVAGAISVLVASAADNVWLR